MHLLLLVIKVLSNCFLLFGRFLVLIASQRVGFWRLLFLQFEREETRMWRGRLGKAALEGCGHESRGELGEGWGDKKLRLSNWVLISFWTVCEVKNCTKTVYYCSIVVNSKWFHKDHSQSYIRIFFIRVMKLNNFHK